LNRLSLNFWIVFDKLLCAIQCLDQWYTIIIFFVSFKLFCQYLRFLFLLFNICSHFLNFFLILIKKSICINNLIKMKIVIPFNQILLFLIINYPIEWEEQYIREFCNWRFTNTHLVRTLYRKIENFILKWFIPSLV
jgi:hypothetical protein